VEFLKNEQPAAVQL